MYLRMHDVCGVNATAGGGLGGGDAGGDAGGDGSS